MLSICKFQILKCASLLFGLEVHMVFLCQKMGVQKLRISFGILELVITIWRISIQKRSGRRSGIWLDITAKVPWNKSFVLNQQGPQPHTIFLGREECIAYSRREIVQKVRRICVNSQNNKKRINVCSKYPSNS